MVLTPLATSDVTADFGYAADPLGDVLSISGTIFEDDDRSAMHEEPAEGSVPGATLLLCNDLDGDGELDPGEPLIGTTFSDVIGDYLFDNLPPGDYLVAVDPDGTPAEDFVQTTQAGTAPRPKRRQNTKPMIAQTLSQAADRTSRRGASPSRALIPVRPPIRTRRSAVTPLLRPWSQPSTIPGFARTHQPARK